MSWLSRLVNVFRGDRVVDDLDDELRFHLESTAERLVAEGLTPDAAEREARRRLGNATVLRERSRDVKLLPWLDTIARDAVFGGKMLRKDAVATVAAVVSLGLAMGACAAAFMLVDALILRRLPVNDPDRLLYLALPPDTPTAPDGTPRREGTSFSYPLYQRFVEASGGRVELMVVAYQNTRQARFADAPDRRERVRAQYVSGNVFGQLGITPSLGRILTVDDDRAGDPRRVAVISHAFWRRRFGGDPSVLGTVLTLDRDKQHEIVGVAREGFSGVEPGILTDVWLPATSFEAGALVGPGWQWFRIWGRLADGVAPEEAAQRLQPVLRQFRSERAARRPADTPLDEQARYVNQRLVARSAATGPSSLRLDFEQPLLVLAAVVGLVLLLACSNVANLLLGRAIAREREMALRMAIGAGRRRLVQQLLVESAMLALAASVMAGVFAWLAAPMVLRWLSPDDMPAYLDLRFNSAAAGFLVLMALVTTLGFGLIPSVRASSVSPIEALKCAGRLRVRPRLLQPLLTVQVALSLAVLSVSALLLFSFDRLSSVSPGFRADGIVLADVETVDDVDRQVGRRALIELLARVRSLPEVTSASASAWPLLTGAGWITSIRLPGGQLDGQPVNFLEVTPGFMDTMGIPLRAGRDVAPADLDAIEPRSVLVNEMFAREYFPAQSALGRLFERPHGDGVVLQEIVGIVGDAKYESLREDVPPTVYVPLRGRDGATLQVRTGQPLAVIAGRLRAEARRTSPALLLTEVTLQSTLVTNTLLRERLLALLSGFFGGVSLVLAAVGLYGVLSYSVVQRTREIGIRRALGAGRGAAVKRILADVAVYGALGVVLGTAFGAYGARFLTALLYDVEPLEPATVLAPIAVLLVVGAVAAAVPARRAASVDPLVALRDE
jgi:predicted permease